MDSKINLNQYGYNEGIAFTGLMDKIAEKVGSIGSSNVNVPMHGIDANGSDSLEVMDLQAAFEENIPPEPSNPGDFLEADFNNDFLIS